MRDWPEADDDDEDEVDVCDDVGVDTTADANGRDDDEDETEEDMRGVSAVGGWWLADWMLPGMPRSDRSGSKPSSA